MLNFLAPIAGPLINLGTTFLKNKTAKKQIAAKIELAKVDHANRLDLSEHELHVLSRKSWDAGWKDEWVVILVSVPIVTMWLGALLHAFTGNPTLLESGTLMAEMLSGKTVDYPTLMLMVIGAVLGIKTVKS